MGNTQRQSGDGGSGSWHRFKQLKIWRILVVFFLFCLQFLFPRNVKERPLLAIKEKDRLMLCFYYCSIRKILGVLIDVEEIKGYNRKTKP